MNSNQASREAETELIFTLPCTPRVVYSGGVTDKKKTAIRSEQELIEHLLAELKNQAELGMFWEFEPVVPDDAVNDLLHAVLSVDNHIERFVIKVEIQPDSQSVDRLTRLRHRFSPYAVLATVHLSAALAEECRNVNVGYLDLNGHQWLRRPGLLIDRRPSDTSFHVKTGDPSLFSTKSQRLARVLLSHREQTWTQSRLAHLTGISSGLISRLKKYCAKRGWIEESRSDWRLIDPDGMLDAWREVDDWKARVTVKEYFAMAPNDYYLAHRLLKPFWKLHFTHWFAAKLRFPYVQMPIVSVYCDRFPTQREEALMNLQEVSGGGRIWWMVPEDPGVLSSGREVAYQCNDSTLGPFPLVSDVQIYLDLLQAGYSGPNYAKALREWEGFCK